MSTELSREAAAQTPTSPPTSGVPDASERGRGGTVAAPGWRSGVGFVVLAAVLAGPGFFAGLGPYVIYVASLTLIYLLAAAGLNLILGYAGQISLAQGAFMGLGGYAVAILSATYGVSPWLAIPAGAVLGFVLGVLIGIPALRVTMHYLAMITLGVHVVFLLVARNEEWLTGGASGIFGVPRPSLGGLSLTSPGGYHVFIAVVVVIALAALYWVLNSTWGRAFKAIRENDLRAAMLGVNVRRYKLLAFAIGSALAALAGGLMAPLLGYIDPTSFGLALTFQLLLMVVVGGSGRFEGPFVGAAIVTLLPEFLRATRELYLVIFAVATIVMLMYMPRGLITVWDVAYRKVTGRPAPSLTK